MTEGRGRERPRERTYSQQSTGEFPWLAAAHPETERRRIALVGPSGASLASSLGSLIQDIAGAGHEIICFAPAFNQPSARALAHMGVQSVPLPPFRQGLSPFADPKSVYRLAKMFRHMQPDIVAGYSAKAAALAAMAGKMAGAGHVVTILAELGRGFAEPPERPSALARTFQKTLLHLAFRLSDTAVFFNEENHRMLLGQNLLPARLRQFPFTGGGVDLAEFRETPLPPLDRGVMFLFAGPLDRRLGVADYCEAARLMRAKSGNFRCLLAGPEIRGPHGFPLTEIKRYREVVQYIGPQADPRPLMTRTHAFVMPAIGDSVPGPADRGDRAGPSRHHHDVARLPRRGQRRHQRNAGPARRSDGAGERHGAPAAASGPDSVHGTVQPVAGGEPVRQPAHQCTVPRRTGTVNQKSLSCAIVMPA